VSDAVAKLKRIAVRLQSDTDDLRHTLLEISQAFLDVTADCSGLPERLHDEIGELRAELADVQPQFASRRQTSVLFDREGLGRKGRRRAKELAARIMAVCDSALRG
jgi:hypothetical protein